MERNEQSADTVLLVYLGGLVGILVCFVALLYWMMQPTVLAHREVGFVERQRPQAASNSHGLLQSAYENERLAIAVAEQENDRQGLQALASGQVISPPPSLAKTPAPQPMKVKKAITGSRQDRAYALQSRPVTAPANPFGLFSGWFR